MDGRRKLCLSVWWVNDRWIYVVSWISTLAELLAIDPDALVDGMTPTNCG